MNPQHLHIVSFDIPYPPDYGGVIDVFYKIRELSRLGVFIHLHCFEYGREMPVELNDYCYRITYYRRKTGFRKQLSLKPYIVKTRVSNILLKNLMADDHPILFEGLHTCFLISRPELNNRLKLVRCHNIEHDYYKGLSHNTTNLIRKAYYAIESARLKRYELILHYADHLLTVTENDYRHFKRYAPATIVRPFHKNQKVRITEGKGEGILFHGNLSVPENYAAVNFLAKEVFSKIEYPVFIAGRKPPPCIREKIWDLKHVQLIPDPDEETLTELIKKARIHLMYTNQDTGLKLKLLNILYNGRTCIVNDKIVAGTGLADACIIADLPAKFLEEINNIYPNPKFDTAKNTELRSKLLTQYNIAGNADRIIKLIQDQT